MAKKTPEQEVAVIAKEVVSLQQQAESLVIKTEADVSTATDFLARLKTKYDGAETMRTFFVKPLNDQVKNINLMFKGQTDPLDKAIRTVKAAISTYTLEQEAEAQRKEAIAQARRDKANAAREEAGKSLILDPVKSVERAAPTVATAAGRTTTKKVWKFEVIKASEVPREYCEPVDKLIRNAVNAGARDIKGVRIYEDVQVSISAN